MPVKTIAPHKSSLGLEANQMALIAYLASAVLALIPGIKYVAWLAPLVLYFLEKESGFVRFNAMQAFVLNACGAVLGVLVTVLIGGALSAAYLGSPTAIGAAFGLLGLVTFLSWVISIAVTVFAVIAAFRAFNYQEYRIPFAGVIAARIAGRLNDRA
jgi:uncharacterized membrane protein